MADREIEVALEVDPLGEDEVQHMCAGDMFTLCFGDEVTVRMPVHIAERLLKSCLTTIEIHREET